MKDAPLFELSPPVDGFDAFWAAYPRKTARKVALAVWTRLKPSKELQGRFMTALVAHKQTEQWRRGVVPHAATWLRQERWNDGGPVLAPPTDLYRAMAAYHRARQGHHE